MYLERVPIPKAEARIGDNQVEETKDDEEKLSGEVIKTFMLIVQTVHKKCFFINLMSSVIIVMFLFASTFFIKVS